MTLFVRTSALAMLLASASWAQTPAPASVVNPASNIPAGLPNYGIAQGSIFTVYGKNLGPATLTVAPSLPLPAATGLGGTTVTVTVNGTTVTAPMVFTVATQLAAVLPSNTPIGTGTLNVTYNGATGSVPITVVQSNFGISTANESGTGPAVVTFPNYSVITVANSAKPGDIVVLWGTGLGPISGSDAAIPAAVDLGTPITVTVGGLTANVTYRGRSGAPGLDQINFVVPAGLSGCYIPIAVQTGNNVSNFATMSVAAANGPCSDPNGLPASITSSGKSTTSIGEISLIQISTTTPAIGPIPASTTVSSGGSAIFERYTIQQIAQSANISGQPTLGGCLVSSSVLTTTTTASSPVISATGLNAGPSLAVTGPASLTLTPLTQVPGFYSGFLMSTLPGGVYTVSNGAGGPDVGGFMTTINLPTALTWTNQQTTTNVTRSKGLPITWTGGSSNGYVYISGTSTSGTGPIVIATFVCTAPVSAGQFTVPPAVLLSLPVSTSIAGFATGSLAVGSFTNPAPFTAPGLDYAFTLSGSLSAASVNYQ